MNKEVTFKSLNLSKEILQSIEEMGYEKPLTIQTAVIPLLLEGKDVTAQSQTGTGKTAAFGIPLAELIDPSKKYVQGIVLCPTRELAIQVNGEIHKICKHKKIKDIPIYGGQDIDRQIKSLRQGVHIVVGTPGRVLDHIRRKTLDLSNVRMAVLDEADEILDMGFIDDIRSILSETSPERQTMLFSATMPEEIKSLARKYMKDPQHISITPHQVTVKLIEQHYYEVKDKFRFESLCRILETEKINSGMIFCRTKRSVDELVEELQSMGYSVEGLHGDLNQNQRTKVLEKFKAENLDFLVATDVAARGLDIESVTHVINFNIPEDPDAYVHRIGRTGRVGRKGTALTLVTAKELKFLNTIEKFTKSRINRREVPTIQDVLEQKSEKFKEQISEVIAKGNLGKYKHLVLELANDHDMVDIASAVIYKLFETDQNDMLGTEEREKSTKETVRLFINMGKKDKVKPVDIVNAIASKAQLPKNIFGAIDIYNSFTFMDVDKECVGIIIDAMKKGKINGKKVNIDRAKALQDKN